MLELFGIRYDVDGVDAAIDYIKSDDGKRAAIKITDDSRFTVDLQATARQITRYEFVKRAKYRSRYVKGTMNQIR